METVPSTRGPSPALLPASTTRHHHAYFSPAEVESLSDKQRGKLSVSQEDKLRQTACSFIDVLGARIGFPRKTVATAQTLYHRFHLFFPRKDFNYVDVALAALFVSTKMHDTLKKPRDLLAAAYGVRFPELAAKSKHAAGEVDLDAMDGTLVERDRQRLLAVERLILETVCFNFTARPPFPYVVKLGRAFGASQPLTRLAWRLAVDSHRTLVPLQYPPHTVALGALYTAALLAPFEPPAPAGARAIATTLGAPGAWERRFRARAEDLSEIAHALLDLLIQGAQSPAGTSPATPSSPASPSPHTPAPAPAPYTADQLIQLKIAMRESEDAHGAPRARRADAAARDDMPALGRDDGTVRFLFGPPGAAG